MLHIQIHQVTVSLSIGRPFHEALYIQIPSKSNLTMVLTCRILGIIVVAIATKREFIITWINAANVLKIQRY